MKTVIDAVNEFKVDIPCALVGRSNWFFYSDDGEINIGLKYGRVRVCTFDQFNDLVSQMETNFGKSYAYSNYKKEFDYHLSPEPALTYTQAMADNGVLPSVGMDCMVFVDENEKEVKEWFKGVVCGEYEGSPVIKLDDLTDGTEGYFDVFSRVDIKPLDPPIELLDGKAYQFDVDGDFMIGIYQESQDHFDSATHITSSSRCTNIELLTVEIK